MSLRIHPASVESSAGSAAPLAAPLATRLTDRLKLRHPVIQAPMALAAGGRLAASVSAAGGLGLIGGGYGDADWLTREFRAAGNQRVGCGFITWSLKHHPELLDQVLAHEPAAICLSFGNPASLIEPIRTADCVLIMQIQTLRDARHALALGADVLVAQGSEAGGHGESRATITLVPEVADLIQRELPDTLLCAAGGIGDGRGLAAALMLGADGVLVGSRFWASDEALVHPAMLRAAVDATGDDTLRSQVMDVARRLNWPVRYTARVLQNAFTHRWHNNREGLQQHLDEEAARWRAAWEAGDTDTANTFVGEVTGLIDSIEPAAVLLERMVNEALQVLQRYPQA